MQLTIPLSPEKEAVLKQKAADAGYADAGQYVLKVLVEPAIAASAAAEESAYDVAKRLGLIGGCAEGPVDLATNPEHLKGLGK